MNELVEFPVDGGGSVLVEVNAVSSTTGVRTRGRDGGAELVVERARHSFEDAIQSVEPATQALINRLRGMTESPDEVHVEFGLDLHAEAGAFIAAASAAANFKVALTWRRKA